MSFSYPHISASGITSPYKYCILTRTLFSFLPPPFNKEASISINAGVSTNESSCFKSKQKLPLHFFFSSPVTTADRGLYFYFFYQFTRLCSGIQTERDHFTTCFMQPNHWFCFFFFTLTTCTPLKWWAR